MKNNINLNLTWGPYHDFSSDKGSWFFQRHSNSEDKLFDVKRHQVKEMSNSEAIRAPTNSLTKLDNALLTISPTSIELKNLFSAPAS